MPLHDLSIEVVYFKSTISKALFPGLVAKPNEMAYVFSYFNERAEANARVESIAT